MPVRLASMQLVRFTKVFLRPAEAQRVVFTLAAADLGYWDDGRNGNDAVGPEGGWVVDPGLFELFVTTSGFGSVTSPAGLRGSLVVS